MERKKSDWRLRVRIIWAITAKDLLEGIKNKNTISILITSLLVVFFYRMLPTFTGRLYEGRVQVYDAGYSTLVSKLEDSENIEARFYETEEGFKLSLADQDLPQIGLVIPADFDQMLASGEEASLQGYLLYWVKEEDASELTQVLESEISHLVGKPVKIQTEGNIVYHTVDSNGIGVQASYGILFILMMVGLSLIGHLFLEEKQQRTIEALLVSPASAGDVVLGKALAGLAYCLLGAGAAIAINFDIIIQWWLLIITVLTTALLTISIGLLIGSSIENRGQLSIWSLVLITGLLIPVFLSLMEGLVPESLIKLFKLLPTVTAFNLFRAVSANPIPIGSTLLQWAYVLAWASVALAATAWLVRRREVGVSQTLLWGKIGQVWKKRSGLAQRSPTPLTSSHEEERTAVLAFQAESEDLEEAQQGAQSEPQGWRIVWAIARKDIREAMHNRIFISLILGVGLMIVMNALLPLLLKRQDLPTAIVYDQGRSAIIRDMRGADAFQIGLVGSQEELEGAISEAQTTRIGLILPADLDQRAAEGEVIQLEGYQAHWAKEDKVSEWTALFEEAFGAATGVPVSINMGEKNFYPALEAGGNPMMVIILLVTVVITLGISLVPLLLIEEKESHTIEAILVSPASYRQLIYGKAVAGSTFCMLAALVVILFNQHLFVHWGVVLLAVALSAALAVAIGLLIGTVADNPASTGMWGVFVLIVVIGLTALQFVDQTSWPQLLRSLISYFPGKHMINLFRCSMVEALPQTQLFTGLAILAAEVGILTLPAGLLLQRRYR